MAFTRLGVAFSKNAYKKRPFPGVTLRADVCTRNHDHGTLGGYMRVGAETKSLRSLLIGLPARGSLWSAARTPALGRPKRLRACEGIWPPWKI